MGQHRTKLHKNKKQIDNIIITDVLVKDEYENLLKKKKGKYITIEYDDVTDYNNRSNVIKVFTEELNKMLKSLNINDKDDIINSNIPGYSQAEF